MNQARAASASRNSRLSVPTPPRRTTSSQSAKRRASSVSWASRSVPGSVEAVVQTARNSPAKTPARWSSSGGSRSRANSAPVTTPPSVNGMSAESPVTHPAATTDRTGHSTRRAVRTSARSWAPKDAVAGRGRSRAGSFTARKLTSARRAPSTASSLGAFLPPPSRRARRGGISPAATAKVPRCARDDRRRYRSWRPQRLAQRLAALDQVGGHGGGGELGDHVERARRRPERRRLDQHRDRPCAALRRELERLRPGRIERRRDRDQRGVAVWAHRVGEQQLGERQRAARVDERQLVQHPGELPFAAVRLEEQVAVALHRQADRAAGLEEAARDRRGR